MKNIVINLENNKKSEIIIKKGLIQELDNDFKNYFLITNETIAQLYPNILSKFNFKKTIVIKDGENYKNFETYELILNELLKRKIERKDTIIALGGGVVGDLAGFCASTVLRGVKLIQIPTTLLAMVDSSIGGKTGINSNFGKNLIGTFYLADKVLIDTTFLKTLNDYEIKCGMGEIIKYALIEKSCKCEKNYNLIEFFEKNDKEKVMNEIDFVIEACANLKATVVQKDCLEGGLRKILNFGHTYAHPIETLSNYQNISHGEAVSWGIKYATKLAHNLKKIDDNYFNLINELINKFNLTTHNFNFNSKDIIELMKQDKKVQNGKINLLIPHSFGCVELIDDIDLPSLEASLL